jgi:LmbE family N-acetylglucosaminyl deacetylase
MKATNQAHKRISGILFSLFLLMIFSPVLSCEQHSEAANSDEKVLMAVFAHPDDETLVGPILHQYANRGVEVILVTATDGRLGFTDFSGIDDEEEVASVRKEELKCAANLLGVELIHLDYEDQLGISGGHNNLIDQTRGILRDLHRLIEERKPDAIITFGPDGFSNHMDHRLVGATVTQAVLNREWEKTPSLFYVGVPASLLEDDQDEQMFMGVDESYLTVEMAFTEEEAETAINAALCHESQFTPEFVHGWFDRLQAWGNVIYFRPFEAPGSRADDIFEYGR